MSERDLLRQNEVKWRSGGEGRLDINGVRWWSCDPYPTWYYWDDNDVLHVRLGDEKAPWARDGDCPVCGDTGITWDEDEQRDVPCGGIGCKVSS